MADMPDRDLRAPVAAAIAKAIGAHTAGGTISAFEARALILALEEVGLAIVPIAPPLPAQIAGAAAHAAAEARFMQPAPRDTTFIRGLKRGMEMAVNAAAAGAIWAAMVLACRVQPGPRAQPAAHPIPANQLHVLRAEGRVCVLDAQPEVAEDGSWTMPSGARVIAAADPRYETVIREMVASYNRDLDARTVRLKWA